MRPAHQIRLTTFVLLACAQMQAQPNRPVVIAHRGNHTRAPENTLQAFRDAIDIGVDYIEVDLRTTRDSVLIVMHDETIDRMTRSRGRVSELSWKYLENVPVLDKKHPENGQHKIALFEEVLRLCKGKTKIYLDFKDASVTSTLRVIEAFAMKDDMAVYVNSKNQLELWNKLAPDIPIIASLPSSQMADVNKLVAENKIDILDGRHTDYFPELVNFIHENKRLIWVDIQQPTESPALWESVLQLPFDGLQTDHPAELIAYLKERGLR